MADLGALGVNDACFPSIIAPSTEGGRRIQHDAGRMIVPLRGAC
ncbi:MAG TPA: hypothetical protein VIF12_02840 [Micavibrio sp.]